MKKIVCLLSLLLFLGMAFVPAQTAKAQTPQVAPTQHIPARPLTHDELRQLSEKTRAAFAERDAKCPEPLCSGPIMVEFNGAVFKAERHKVDKAALAAAIEKANKAAKEKEGK